MPVIKSAIKKLRKDKKREKENNALREQVEKTLKLARKQKTVASASKAFSLVDKAVKKNLLHKNKAARIKSSLSKALPSTKASATARAKSAPAKLKAPKAPAKRKPATKK